jgi:hypothetical protein
MTWCLGFAVQTSQPVWTEAVSALPMFVFATLCCLVWQPPLARSATQHIRNQPLSALAPSWLYFRAVGF